MATIAKGRKTIKIVKHLDINNLTWIFLKTCDSKAGLDLIRISRCLATYAYKDIAAQATITYRNGI